MRVRLVPRLLRLAATTLAIGLSVLLLMQFLDRSSEPGPKNPKVLSTTAPGSMKPASCSRDGLPLLRLHVRRLDMQRDVATVSPSLCLTARALLRLRARPSSRGPRQALVELISDSYLLVKPPFHRAEVVVYLHSSRPPSDYEATVPLGRYEGQAPSGGVERRLPSWTLPIVGSSQDYPLDQYAFAVSGQLMLPPDLSSMRLDAAFETGQQGLRGDQGTDRDFLVVRVSRARAPQAFVVGLLLIPLLLIAVLALARRGGSTSGTETIVGAVAVLLALLPIRAVLVPADITSLTLVDYALGAQVALLATIVVFRETAR